MQPIRPIGHIACGLNMLAINIGYRMRMSRAGCAYACWVDDDGCVYLEPTTHPRAAAVLRNAPEQRINTYRKPAGGAFPLTATDITADLVAARHAHALRQLQQAQPEALTA